MNKSNNDLLIYSPGNYQLSNSFGGSKKIILDHLFPLKWESDNSKIVTYGDRRVHHFEEIGSLYATAGKIKFPYSLFAIGVFPDPPYIDSSSGLKQFDKITDNLYKIIVEEEFADGIIEVFFVPGSIVHLLSYHNDPSKTTPDQPVHDLSSILVHQESKNLKTRFNDMSFESNIPKSLLWKYSGSNYNVVLDNPILRSGTTESKDITNMSGWLTRYLGNPPSSLNFLNSGIISTGSTISTIDTGVLPIFLSSTFHSESFDSTKIGFEIGLIVPDSNDMDNQIQIVDPGSCIHVMMDISTLGNFEVSIIGYGGVGLASFDINNPIITENSEITLSAQIHSGCIRVYANGLYVGGAVLSPVGVSSSFVSLIVDTPSMVKSTDIMVGHNSGLLGMTAYSSIEKTIGPKVLKTIDSKYVDYEFPQGVLDPPESRIPKIDYFTIELPNTRVKEGSIVPITIFGTDLNGCPSYNGKTNLSVSGGATLSFSKKNPGSSNIEVQVNDNGYALLYLHLPLTNEVVVSSISSNAKIGSIYDLSFRELSELPIFSRESETSYSILSNAETLSQVTSTNNPGTDLAYLGWDNLWRADQKITASASLSSVANDKWSYLVKTQHQFSFGKSSLESDSSQYTRMPFDHSLVSQKFCYVENGDQIQISTPASQTYTYSETRHSAISTENSLTLNPSIPINRWVKITGNREFTISGENCNTVLVTSYPGIGALTSGSLPPKNLRVEAHLPESSNGFSGDSFILMASFEKPDGVLPVGSKYVVKWYAKGPVGQLNEIAPDTNDYDQVGGNYLRYLSSSEFEILDQSLSSLSSGINSYKIMLTCPDDTDATWFPSDSGRLSTEAEYNSSIIPNHAKGLIDNSLVTVRVQLLSISDEILGESYKTIRVPNNTIVDHAEFLTLGKIVKSFDIDGYENSGENEALEFKLDLKPGLYEISHTGLHHNNSSYGNIVEAEISGGDFIKRFGEGSRSMALSDTPFNPSIVRRRFSIPNESSYNFKFWFPNSNFVESGSQRVVDLDMRPMNWDATTELTIFTDNFTTTFSTSSSNELTKIDYPASAGHTERLVALASIVHRHFNGHIYLYTDLKLGGADVDTPVQIIAKRRVDNTFSVSVSGPGLISPQPAVTNISSVPHNCSVSIKFLKPNSSLILPAVSWEA